MAGSCELNLDADELYVMSPDAAWFNGINGLMVKGLAGSRVEAF
jgi:hypothetical protein